MYLSGMVLKMVLRHCLNGYQMGSIYTNGSPFAAAGD